jgi:hypothetical protein
MEWYSESITPETHPQLFDYLKQFTFTSDESENIRSYLREAIAAGDLSLSALADRDKFLRAIKELLLQPSDQNIQLIHKIKAIITPFLENELTTFVRSDDDLIRMISIFFFYLVYSIYPLVSGKSEFKGSGIGPTKLREILRKFLKIPNENFQFSIMAYLLIDKYMDEQCVGREEFLGFCKSVFSAKECVIDMAKTSYTTCDQSAQSAAEAPRLTGLMNDMAASDVSANILLDPKDRAKNDVAAFQHYYQKLVSVYPVEKWPHLYDFMDYLFQSLDRSAKVQSKVSGSSVDRAKMETFSKSYLTIYFFILMSNLELKGQSVEAVMETAKKAWLIQCYDDICDIHQDIKNGVETLFTYWVRMGDGDGDEGEDRGEGKGKRLYDEMTQIFHHNLLYIYQTLHAESPLLCRTLIYITLHIHNFLIYKNRKFLPDGMGLFRALYMDFDMFDGFGIDLFSSTQILIPFLRKCLMME